MSITYASLKGENKKFGEIEVYPLNEEIKIQLLKMAEENTVDGKMTLEGTELMGRIMKLMTNIPHELLDDEEVLEDIIEKPSDDLEDAIAYIENKVQRYFIRFQKQIENLSNVPEEILKSLAEDESKKAFDKQKYEEYLKLKEEFEQ